MAESSTGQPKPAAAKAKEGSTWQAKGKQPNLCTPCGELCTWDLNQPLTRRCEAATPRTMQLDFLFVNQPDEIATSTTPKSPPPLNALPPAPPA